MQPSEDFYIYRRHLPHFRSKGRLYFVTWRLDPAQADLTPGERDDVVSALKHFEQSRYELWGYVVMNDHVHVLVWPEDHHPLEEALHSWKSFTAHKFVKEYGRTGSIWQHESFDRIVRNEKERYGKMVYVLNNPRKRWPDIKIYKWVWCKGME